MKHNRFPRHLILCILFVMCMAWCTTSTAYALDNVIQNGGFEDGFASWEAFNARLDTSPSAARSGNACCTGWVPEHHAKLSSIRQHLQLEPGAEYEALRERIEQGLRGLADPEDGRPVVSRIVRREEAFHGPMTEAAPDLIVVMRDLAYITRHGYEFSPQPGKVLSPFQLQLSGTHRMEGLLIAAGATARTGGFISQGADLMDMAPTVLQVLGCPVPTEMDGRPLHDWVSPTAGVEVDKDASAGHQTGAAASDWADADEQSVLQRLRDLGYLE